MYRFSNEVLREVEGWVWERKPFRNDLSIGVQKSIQRKSKIGFYEVILCNMYSFVWYEIEDCEALKKKNTYHYFNTSLINEILRINFHSHGQDVHS